MSWRSCGAVLDLVNAVCGNTGLMAELFGEAAGRWNWEDHVPARKGLSGEARVEQWPKDDHRAASGGAWPC